MAWSLDERMFLSFITTFSELREAMFASEKKNGSISFLKNISVTIRLILKSISNYKSVSMFIKDIKPPEFLRKTET